jgi:hypothetical protein
MLIAKSSSTKEQLKQGHFLKLVFLNESLRNFWLSELTICFLLSSPRSYGSMVWFLQVTG